MADFALGLTKTAVEGTLSFVKSAIEQEKKLKEKVEDDLVFITGEFQMMQSFLRVANRERAKNEVVQTWVRQVRNMAFNVEDCVEFVVINIDNRSAMGWLRRSWHTVSQHLRRTVLCCATPPPLDVAVEEIKQLKARVLDVSQRNTRYHLISDDSGSSSKPIMPAEQLAAASMCASALPMLREIWDDMGRRRDIYDLKTLITGEGNDRQVITICASAEVRLEATSILRKAYSDPEICQEFKFRAWVHLAHPFNPDEFLKSLLTQFRASSHQANVAPDDELMQQVTEQRYLVILDQVSVMSEWYIIQMYLQDRQNGSRIVVSTQDIGIALLCTEEPYQVSELRRFSNGQSITAFFKEGAGLRNNIGELLWQLRCRGVFSILGTTRPDIVDHLKSLIYFGDLKFEHRSCILLEGSLDERAFAEKLLRDFCLQDGDQDEKLGDTDPIQRSCNFLREKKDCLVVIIGLKSTDDWDKLNSMFFSGLSQGNCILVLTDEANVAIHCADHEYRVIRGKDLVAETLGAGLRSDMGELLWQLRCRGVFSILGTGYPDIVDHLKTLMHFEGQRFEHRSLLLLEDSLDERAFAENLLRDFHLHDEDQDEEVGAKDIKEGTDPIQRCCNFLHKKDCLLIIIGLKSTDDWDTLKSIFFYQLSKGSCILVHTDDANVATYCADHEYRVLRGKDLVAGMLVSDDKEASEEKDYSRIIQSGFMEKNYEMSPRMKEACLWYEFELLGRGEELGKLSSLCKEPPRVVSVWGIAGVGKSALVRKLYSSKMLHLDNRGRREFAAYSWVDVPQPFNLKEFSWSLLLDFHSDDLPAKEAALIAMLQGQDPTQGCCQFLHDYKCLVVIDGLQSKDDWNLIKEAFLCKPTHACIVVITNEESVAKYCADGLEKRQVVNVKVLKDDLALRLFKKIAWGSEQHGSYGGIVTKCGGLPRIIAAIGEYFKEITYDRVPVKQDFIEAFGDHFMVALETYPDQGFTSLRGLFSWMQHYIDSGSDSLRPCIFYIPVFPANTKIRRNRLLRRWIAEGYSRDTSRVSAENWGSMFFSQLIDLSIIHQDCKTNLWKVNGFFYEYIITRPTEDNLVFALEDHYAWDNLVSELEGQSDRDSQRTRQHLTIRSSWVRDETVFNSFDFSRLRSLTVFGEWKPFFITKNMKLLRVLDLEGTTHGLTNDDLEQIGKILSRLKFLSLRGCKNIDRLPNSLGGMRLLQTLDVRHTSIVTLPSAIAKLEKLQYIRAGTTVPSNKDWKSTPTEDGDGTGPSQPVAAGPKPVEEADITDPSQLPPPPAAATVPIKTEDGKGIGPSQQTVIDVQVSSWLSKLRCIKRLGNGGVEVPARIGSLMVLHTPGVVNVSGASGKTILKEIKKLTKLRKLGVSGINSGNIEQLWSTISDLFYLESLSVRVDMGKKGSYVSLDGISQLPKTLKSLKLYGHIHRMPLWIRQLGHLKKLDLETTILTAQDIDDVLGELPENVFISLCVKPMVHDEFIFKPKVSLSLTLRVLKIDCTSNNLQVKFGYVCVHLLILHCSSGSSLGISGLQNLDELKEVWLKGSYGEALKKELQRQIEEWPADESVPKPVLKLDE